MNPQDLVSSSQATSQNVLPTIMDSLNAQQQISQLPSIPQNTAQSAPSTPTQPTKHPGFFERILPTAGSILGGIGGTIFGGPVGGIAGAAGGGGIGQELENLLTGGNQSTKAAAIEGGAGQAVGGIIGKGLSTLAGKVIAPLAEKGATQLVGAQAKGQLTGDIAHYLTGHGFTDLNKAGQMADVLTGSAAGQNADIEGKAILNKFVEDTLRNNGPQKVDITDLTMPKLAGKNPRLGEITAEGNNNLLQNSITKNSLSDTPQAQAIRTRINSITNGLPQDINGMTDNMSALDFQRQTARLANEHFQDYIDSGRQNANALNMSKTYQDISSALKDKLGLSKIAVSDEDKQALAKDVLKFGSNINPDAAQKIANVIGGAKELTLGDVRGLEQNWVTVKRALQTIADQANKNFGTGTADIARSTLPLAGAVTGMGGKKSLLGTIGGLATASPSADSKIAGVLSGLSDKSQGKVVQKILPLATRAGTVAAFNLPNMAQGGPQQTTNLPQSSNINTGNVMQNPLTQLYSDLLTQEQASPYNFAQSLAPVLSQLAPVIQKQQLAAPAVSDALSTYYGAGGPQGEGGGLLSQLTGLIPGTPAYTYAHQRAASSALLGQILGIKPEEAQGLMPSLMQTPEAAAPQISGLTGISGILGGLPTPSAVPAQ